jgi:hypothetical protein
VKLVERILCKLFPYIDILRDDTNDLYLRRFFIYPRNKDLTKNQTKPRLYLHKFYRGDEDPHMHDHPWDFTSLILTQGYWEEVPGFSGLPDEKYTRFDSTYGADGDYRYRYFFPRFSLLHRLAEHKHRVILKDSTPVWTLVLTEPKRRKWGFWIRDTFCPWKNYHAGICWCVEQENLCNHTLPDGRSSMVEEGDYKHCTRCLITQSTAIEE